MRLNILTGNYSRRNSNMKHTADVGVDNCGIIDTRTLSAICISRYVLAERARMPRIVRYVQISTFEFFSAVFVLICLRVFGCEGRRVAIRLFERMVFMGKLVFFLNITGILNAFVTWRCIHIDAREKINWGRFFMPLIYNPKL